jgi:hypothetical protein
MSRCSLSVCLVVLMWACSISSGRRYPVGGSRWYTYIYNDKSLLGTLSQVSWGLGIRTSRNTRFSTYDLLSIFFIIVLALTLTIQDAYDGGNESSKLVSTIIFWRFIKLAITASLREGPFFYFYVESPPSTFMHRQREHSCHSEYNMHCPKVFIDWFMMLVSLVLKLFVFSRPLKLEGVLCIYVLLSHEGQAENHLLCFSIWFEHTFDFYCLIFMIFSLCSFSCYNMVAKFVISRLYLSCPCFKFFWSQRTTLTLMIKIV